MLKFFTRMLSHMTCNIRAETKIVFTLITPKWFLAAMHLHMCNKENPLPHCKLAKAAINTQTV